MMTMTVCMELLDLFIWWFHLCTCVTQWQTPADQPVIKRDTWVHHFIQSFSQLKKYRKQHVLKRCFMEENKEEKGEAKLDSKIQNVNETVFI